MKEALENRRWRLVYRCLWVLIQIGVNIRGMPSKQADQYVTELEQEIERDV